MEKLLKKLLELVTEKGSDKLSSTRFNSMLITIVFIVIWVNKEWGTGPEVTWYPSWGIITALIGYNGWKTLQKKWEVK